MEKTAITITNFDPIGFFIKEKLKLSPLAFALSIFIADLIVDVFLGFHFNVFFNPSFPTTHTPGLLEDMTALITDFVVNPIIAFVYLWILNASAGLFQNLKNNKVFTSEDIFEQELERSKKLYNSRIIFFLIIILAGLLTLNQVAAYNHWVQWNTIAGYLYLRPEMSFFRAPFWFITMYGLMFSLYNDIITIFTLQKIFRHPQTLKLYHSHPDRCAGFGDVGKYIANIGFVIAPISFWISIAVISELRRGDLLNAYPVIFAIAVYLILAPIIFFWPILSVHQAMADPKKKLLLEFSEKINSAYSELRNHSNNVKKQWETIEVYQKLYDKFSGTPEWPFNTENIQRFFVVTGSSLLPALTAYSIDLITVKLLPYLRTFFPFL